MASYGERLFAVGGLSMADLVVKTSLGPVRGYQFETERGHAINAFEGIPYAKPPVGELRFKPPVPVEPWTDVLDATKPPAKAACLLEIPQDPPVVTPGTSEDCLYLNVFTPNNTSPSSKLPVMVYIHGGGFTTGNGNRALYGPDFLVPKGVIQVNINYRLGPFGFLSLKTTEYSGNNGLKDQNLGLRWVRDNIGAFGGDANNVTLFGESAGSASVQYHTLSPLSRGLFHRAAALSASVLNRFAHARYPVESAIALAKKLGATSADLNEVIQVLKGASTEDILKNTTTVFKEVEGVDWIPDAALSTLPFVPTTEPEGTPNAFLTKHPQQALLDGDTADVPYITGVCSEETIFFLPSADYVPDLDDETTLQRMLPKELGVPLGSPKIKEAAAKLKNFYFPNGATQEGFIQAQSMLVFNYGVFKTVRILSQSPKKTTPNYLYLFNPNDINSFLKPLFNVSQVKGVCHADDLRFLFHMEDPAYKIEPIKKGTNEEVIMETFTTLLTDWAKTGKLPSVWQSAEESNNWSYIEIQENISSKQGFLADEVKVWDEIHEILQN